MIAETIYGAIEKIWPMITIFLVVICAVRIAYLRTNSKEFVLYKEIMNLVFVIYLLLLFEMVTNRDIGNGGVNLVPFTEIFRYNITSKQFLYNVIGNIVVFIPFGYFVSYSIKTKKIGQVFIITLLTSLTIELVQLQIGRAFDIDDILLNLLGGVLGYLIYIGLTAIKNNLPGIFQKDFFYNVLCIILLLFIILYVTNVFGFGWNF